MKPVFQKIIDADTGDCFTACLASVLEIPYEEVPNFVFDLHSNGKIYEFYQTVAKWLKERGLNMVTVSAKHLADWRCLGDLHAIASVPSQKFPGITHAVVVKWTEIPEHKNCYKCSVIHDPNPENDLYKYDDIITLSFILPTVPKICLPNTSIASKQPLPVSSGAQAIPQTESHTT